MTETSQAALNVEHDALITQILERAREEHARGSDASESAAKVKAFLENTNLNSQAFSWAKTIIKKMPKKDGQLKALDVIRSLEEILPMLKNHVINQGTFDMPLEAPKADPVEYESPDESARTDEQVDFDTEVDDNVEALEDRRAG